MSRSIEHPLMNLPKYGDGLCLHRVLYLLRAQGIDLARVGRRSMVVTGSNGKGSTSVISSHLLQSLGGRVGLFTSPHLFRYNERFQINGVQISDDALRHTMDLVARDVERYQGRHHDAVGAFEVQFVVAITWFETQMLDWLVLEAGIGGRYDPVRLAKSDVGALVSLDFEHTELLGKTLQEIAFDKMDAVRRGGTVIIGESCVPLREQIAVYAELCELEVVEVSRENWKDGGVDEGWQRFEIDMKQVELRNLKSRLIGPHQLNNHAVAIRLCYERLRRAGTWPEKGVEEVWRQAIEDVMLPGRLEKVWDKPPVYIDVGHTPEGISAALAGFHSLRLGKRAILVTGGSRGKSVKGMVSLLAPHFDYIICTSAHHNGLPSQEVALYAVETNPSASVVTSESIEAAAAVALADAERLDRVIYVAGGLFLAAEFAEALRGGDPGALRFF